MSLFQNLHPATQEVVKAFEAYSRKVESAAFISPPPRTFDYDRVVVDALNQQLSEIRNLFRRLEKPNVGASEEFLMHQVGKIFDLVLRSDRFVESQLSPEQIIPALIEKAYSWRHFCKIHDQECSGLSTPVSADQLQSLFSTALADISERPELMRSSMHAAQKLSAQLLQYIDPLSVITDVDEFREFQFFQGAIDPSPTITGVAMDFYRTKQFLGAVADSVKYLEQKFSGQTIHIIDAGSGPLGILGLYALVLSEKVEVDFIEVHPSSAAALNSMLKKLGLQHRARVHCQDALTYRPEQLVHAVFSETIGQALGEEPFPQIIQHLRNFLIEGGKIVPQKVSISLLAIEENAVENKTARSKLTATLPLGVSWPYYDASYRAAAFEFNSYATSGVEMKFEVPHAKLPKDVSYLFVLQTTIEASDQRVLLPGQSLIANQKILMPGTMQNPEDATTVYMTRSRRERANSEHIIVSIGSPNTKVSVQAK